MEINDLKKQLFESIENICKDYEEKQKPEFKVGDWVYQVNGDKLRIRDRLTRITRIEGTHVWCKDIAGESWLDKDKFKNWYRHATPDEIPPSKKALPTTKEEAYQFLSDYERMKNTGTTRSKFIEDFED